MFVIAIVIAYRKLSSYYVWSYRLLASYMHFMWWVGCICVWIQLILCIHHWTLWYVSSMFVCVCFNDSMLFNDLYYNQFLLLWYGRHWRCIAIMLQNTQNVLLGGPYPLFGSVVEKRESSMIVFINSELIVVYSYSLKIYWKSPCL